MGISLLHFYVTTFLIEKSGHFANRFIVENPFFLGEPANDLLVIHHLNRHFTSFAGNPPPGVDNNRSHFQRTEDLFEELTEFFRLEFGLLNRLGRLAFRKSNDTLIESNFVTLFLTFHFPAILGFDRKHAGRSNEDMINVPVVDWEIVEHIETVSIQNRYRIDNWFPTNCSPTNPSLFRLNW